MDSQPVVVPLTALTPLFFLQVTALAGLTVHYPAYLVLDPTVVASVFLARLVIFRMGNVFLHVVLATTFLTPSVFNAPKSALLALTLKIASLAARDTTLV